MLLRPGQLLTPIARRAVSSGALILLGNEWSGFSLDFITNDYAIQRPLSQSETLLGTGPDTTEAAVLALDFTDNTSAIRS